MMITIIIIILSPVWKVFTTVYPKQTVSVRYMVLQLFYSYNLRYM